MKLQKPILLPLLATAVLLLSACTGKLHVKEKHHFTDPTAGRSNVTKLIKIDTKVGHGPEAKEGKLVTVQYTGWLYDEKAKDHKGKKFDSSYDRNDPFSFQLGAGTVIRGWDEGLIGMKVGGKRTLIIPPDLAYGSRAMGNVIPPNSTLVFDVELLDVD